MAAPLLAFSSGGYFVTSWGAASIAFLGLLAIALMYAQPSIGGRWGALALAGLGGLAAWQGVSSAWADEPSGAILAMNRTVLYAAAFALVLLGVRRARDLTALLGAALLAAAVVCGAALASRLLPAIVGGDHEARLATPISYWNGLGLIVAVGTVLAVATAGRGASPAWVRIPAGALVPAFLLALLFTYSRGGLVALLVGVALLVALAPGRPETVGVLVASAAVSVPLLVVANGEDALSALGGRLPPHEDEGLRILLLLLATMAVAGAAVALARAAVARLRPEHRRRAGWGIGGAVVLTAALLVGTHWPSGGPLDWGERQLESFKSFDPGARAEAETISERLAVAAGSGRWQNWGVAVDQFAASPVAGTGAGDYRFRWDEHRDIDLSVENAHSLYLEVLGESGLVGLVLLLLPAAAVVGALVPALRRSSGTIARDLVVAAAAAAAVGVHLAGDWTWQLPATVLAGVALGAGALKAAVLARADRPLAAEGRPARWSLALVALVAVVAVAGPLASAARVGEARERAVRGDLAGALGLARDAASIDAWDPAPRLLIANLLSDLGRPAEADSAFRDAMARSPRDWTIAADWAAALVARGDLRAARVAALRARRLNPRELRTTYLLEASRS